MLKSQETSGLSSSHHRAKTHSIQQRRATRALSRWTGWPLSLILFGALSATCISAIGFSFIGDGILLLLCCGIFLLAVAQTAVKGIHIGIVLIGFLLLGTVAIGVLSAGYVSGNHMYLIFAGATALVVWRSNDLSQRVLLGLTNSYYIVYLVLSLGVYLGIIVVDSNLNIFEADQRVTGLGFSTLVGFYGSTAHIDSLSLFVALVNLLYGRGVAHKIVFVIGLLASAATLRYTPFFSLAIALTCAALVYPVKATKAGRKITIGLLVSTIAISAPLVVTIGELSPDDQVHRLLNTGTSGRSRIWEAMIDTYVHVPGLQKLFGTGTTEGIYLVGGWPRVNPVTGEVKPLYTENPHNSYFSIALTTGLFGYGLLVAGLLFLSGQSKNWKSTLITFYILAVGITNAELFTFMFPVYLIWLVFLNRPVIVNSAAAQPQIQQA